MTVIDHADRRLTSEVTNDGLYDFVIAVTTDQFPAPNHNLEVDQVVLQISNWIRNNSENKTIKARAMRIKEFLQLCEEAGDKVKDSGGSIVVSMGNRSVRFGGDTRKIDGPVLKRWLKILNMSEQSGVGIDDFTTGAFEARDQFQRFIRTLRRLAKS